MARLLFADDDPAIRRVFQRLFPAPDWDVDVAPDGASALELLEQSDYDAVISDYRMPRMNGGELLARACALRPKAVRILVTAESDFEVAVTAVNQGEVFRLVRKPWNDDDLQFVVRSAVGLRRMREEKEQILADLDVTTRSLEEVNGELEAVNRVLEERILARTRAIVDTLVAALDQRDPAASARARRIAGYARRLAEALGLADGSRLAIEQGALLHEVGKLGIRDDLFFKRAPLSETEWSQLRQHPALGERMLRPIEFLDEARRIVLHHRECWDGTGYPAGLSGEEIAPGARIFAVAEQLEAVFSDPYYPGTSGYVVARAEIQRGAGKRFDPAVADAFCSVPSKEWLELGGAKREPSLREVA